MVERDDQIPSLTQSVQQPALGGGLPIPTAVPNATSSTIIPSHPLEHSDATRIEDAHNHNKRDEETTSESANSAEDESPSSSANKQSTSNSNENENEKFRNDSLSRSVTMTSSEDEEAHKPNKASLIDLFRFASKWDLIFNAIGLVAAITAGAAQPLMTIVFGNLTTSFLNFTNAANQDPATLDAAASKLRSEINKDALYLLYIGIAMFAATYIYMATWVYTGEEITRRIRVSYLTSVLRQDIAYFDELGPGEVTTRIQSDIQLIQEGISDKIPMSVMFISTFITGFIVAYARSWKLALALSSIIPLVMISGAVMNILMSKAQQIELEHVSHGATVAEEAIATVRTAKAFGIEQRLVDLYDESNTEATKLGIRKSIINGIGMGAFFFVIYSGYALAFYFGSKLIASGEIASGVVMTVIFSIFIGAFSMAMLAPNMQSLAYALGAGGKIFETIDRTPPIDSSSEEGARPETCNGEIELKSVDFTYPARPEVQILEDFSVKIPAGKVSALVGSSGSGKSTIVGLVERFYDVDSGSVLLDHINVRDLNLKWLRTQIGLVSQEPTLFATTISKNIEHGLINSPYENLEPEKKQELIVEAAKKANAHDFVSQLPNGYETMVGERGFLLSGGQKQRIAIARAIVKNPRILLLDEATSALDTTSEGIVQQALDQASVGRTTITIAHRLSTIKKADNIIVMGKGRILEQGTHESLLADPTGPYSSLVNAQKIRANTSSEQNAYEQEDELEAERLRAEQELEKEREAAKTPELGGRISRSISRTRSITSVLMAERVAKKEEEEGKQKMRGTLYLLRRLALINKEYIWTLYVTGFIASVAAGAVYPCFAILFGRSLQNFSKCSSTVAGPCPEPFRSDMRHDANLNALYFFIISLIATLCVCIQTHNLMLASTILMERLRRLMLKAYLRADISFHDEDNHNSGALTASIADSAQKVNGLVGITLGTILQSISTLVVGFIIALAYGWKLALVVIACSPLTLSAGFVRLKLVVLKDAKIKKAHEESAQRACEAAAAIRTVASLTREADCMKIYREALRAPAKVTHNAAIYSNILYALSQSFAFWVIALGFWYGSRLLIDGELDPSKFFTVLTAVVFGSIQAGNVFSFAPDISNAATAADGAIRVLDSRPEIDSENPEGLVLENCEGNIKFESVHFRYPTRPSVRVLRGITMDIKKGSYVGLVGASGSGKSTTIQLLQRFYDPAVGQVTIDGHDIKDLNLKEYRRHVALVSQEPSLYDGTIAFNLRLGAFEDADKVTDEMMRKAASEANILNFIESLPNGFETEVGGRGTQLSGGQKQRIAIARAIIRNPKILLLDEATSALDSESEKVVQEALDKAARGRTTIAIAHRLSSISKSDRIFVLKDGLIQESGTHTNLMQLKGLYSELVQLQELQKD